MDCASVEKFLHGIAARELDLAQDELVSYHLKHCQSCQDSYAGSKHYFRIVEQMAAPDLSPERAESLLRSTRTMQHQTPQARINLVGLWFSRGFNQSLVLACTLVLIVFAGVFSRPPVDTDENLISATHALASSNISLVIEVPSDMLQADLSLEFPDQLRWRGLEELQRIEWVVDLQQGANVLELPVTLISKLTNSQPLIITASLKYQQKTKYFELPVKISDENSIDNSDIQQLLI